MGVMNMKREEFPVIRDFRQPGGVWVPSFLIDKYLPEIGFHAFVVYLCLQRYAQGGGQIDMHEVAAKLRLSRAHFVAAVDVLIEHEMISWGPDLIILDLASDGGAQ